MSGGSGSYSSWSSQYGGEAPALSLAALSQASQANAALGKAAELRSVSRQQVEGTDGVAVQNAGLQTLRGAAGFGKLTVIPLADSKEQPPSGPIDYFPLMAQIIIHADPGHGGGEPAAPPSMPTLPAALAVGGLANQSPNPWNALVNAAAAQQLGVVTNLEKATEAVTERATRDGVVIRSAPVVIPRCVACHWSGVSTGTAKVGDLPLNMQIAAMRWTKTTRPEDADFVLKEAKETKDATLDRIQDVINVIGMFDPTPLSDGFNAVLYGVRGKGVDATTSAAGMFPYVGDLGKFGKTGAKVAGSLDNTANIAKVGKQADNLAHLANSGNQAAKVDAPNGAVSRGVADTPQARQNWEAIFGKRENPHGVPDAPGKTKPPEWATLEPNLTRTSKESVGNLERSLKNNGIPQPSPDHVGHHVIPGSIYEKSPMLKEIGFRIDHFPNGHWVHPDFHPGRHPAYTSAMKKILGEIPMPTDAASRAAAAQQVGKVMDAAKSVLSGQKPLLRFKDAQALNPKLTHAEFTAQWEAAIRAAMK